MISISRSVFIEHCHEPTRSCLLIGAKTPQKFQYVWLLECMLLNSTFTILNLFCIFYSFQCEFSIYSTPIVIILQYLTTQLLGLSPFNIFYCLGTEFIFIIHVEQRLDIGFKHAYGHLYVWWRGKRSYTNFSVYMVKRGGGEIIIVLIEGFSISDCSPTSAALYILQFLY